MKDKITIEEYHKNHIKVRLKEIKSNSVKSYSINSAKLVSSGKKKKMGFNYKDILNNISKTRTGYNTLKDNPFE